MLRKLIAGNWKMNGLQDDAHALVTALASGVAQGDIACDMLVCPPFTLIHSVRETLDRAGIALGGQDCHSAPKGAFTGDVAAPMLADLGCSYVIVGHSERRHGHGESSETIAQKAAAALGSGLTPIICVGETEAEREAGRALEILSGQISGSLPADKATEIVIAYEPVWAIGTGRTATPDDVAQAHGHIRQQLQAHLGDAAQNIRLLYGGSVKPGNARDLLAVPNVDGALVGGASLDAESFLGIAQGASV